MAEHEAGESFGRVLWQEVARVIPWGILFIILILLFAGAVVRPLGPQVARGLRGAFADPTLKQEIKEAGEYFSSTVIRAVKSSLLTDPALKQDVKEAFEYASQHLVTGSLTQSLHAAFADPTLKQDIKAANDSLSSALMRAVKNNVLEDPALKQNVKEAVEFWMTLAVDAIAVRLLNNAGLKQDVKETLEYASHQLTTNNPVLNRLGELEKHIQRLESQNAELHKQQGGVSRGQ